MKKVLRRTMCFVLAAVMALAMVTVSEIDARAEEEHAVMQGVDMTITPYNTGYYGGVKFLYKPMHKYEICDIYIYNSEGVEVEYKQQMFVNTSFEEREYYLDSPLNNVKEFGTYKVVATIKYFTSTDAFDRNAEWIQDTASYTSYLYAQPKDESKKNLPYLGDIKIPDQLHTGYEICPAITIKDGDNVLVEGVDYEKHYKNNILEGKAGIVVRGIGDYTGTQEINFFIKSAEPHIYYKTYVQRTGWQDYSKDGDFAGTKGKGYRLEGIKIYLTDGLNKKLSATAGSVYYKTYVQKEGWQSWKKNDAISGTMGQAKRLEAIEIKLTGDVSKDHDVYYRVYAQRFGWMGWAKNGANSGTAGYGYRLEGIQIQVIRKNAKAPTSTKKAFQKKQ